jgi:hypothetical protein
MSPIAEKLAAVLADWDEMVTALADARKQITAKEEAVVNLQQQYIRQASEITTLRGKISVLEMQVADAVLMATDPDDAKLLSRIEAAYATLTPRNGGANGNGAPAKSSAAPVEKISSDKTSSDRAATAAQIAVTLSPPVASPADVPAPAAKASGETSASTKPARSATPGKPASLRDVVFKLVE